MKGFFKELEVAGLEPESWICVGSGYSSEDVKEAVLCRGHGFIADAFTDLDRLCLKILNIKKKSLLGSQTRQEVLKMLLRNSKISVHLVELRKMRRQRGFFKSLDLALQAGRLASAHLEEELVYAERLKSHFGPSLKRTDLTGDLENTIRTELQKLSMAYEAWLEASGSVDRPYLLKSAYLACSEGNSNVNWPRKIYYLTVQKPESLEQSFWDELAKQVEVKICGPPETGADLPELSERLWTWPNGIRQWTRIF